MASKLKFFLAVTAGMAATAAAGAYIIACSPPAPTHNSVNAPAQQTNRANYKFIPLETIKSSQQGNDPGAIALEAFSSMESESRLRELRVEYPQPNLAVVIITQTGLLDDSIAGIRYRVELISTSESAQTGKEWKIVWAGWQVKCYPGRGHQDWSTKECV
jgi:hypothetical protein